MSTAPPADEQLRVLRKVLRRVRTALALVALLLAVFLAIGMYLLLHGEQLVRDKEKELLAATEREVETHSDQLLEAAGEVASDNLPILSQALTNQIQNDLPEYVRVLDEQGDELSRSLEKHFRARIEGRYQEQLTGYRTILQQEFPEETDPKAQDAMMAALREALDRVADRYFLREFTTQISDLKDLWNHVPPWEVPAGREPTLETQLQKSAQEWVMAKILEGGLRSGRGFLPGGGKQ